MPCVAREIVVTDLLILSAITSPCKSQPDVPFYKRSTASIYATALFGSQCEGGYISFNFVEKALGSPVSGVCPTVRVTWHLAIFDQSTETSHLRVVSALDHDVVFGRGSGCCNWTNPNPPVSQQRLSNNHGSQEGWLEHLAKLEDSKLDEKLADVSFIQSFAASCGIGLEGKLSVKAFAILLRRRIQHVRHGGRLAGGNNPPPLTRAATPDTRTRSEDVESLVGSEFDECGLEYEGSTTGSEIMFERNVDQPPSFLRGARQACTQDIPGTSIQVTQLPRGSSPGDSIRSWQLVESASPNATTTEGDAPTQACQKETEKHEEPAVGQGQVSDFDMHPGHRVWVWDKDRQRWRRRGRSGEEETDWFPESFAC